MPRPTPNGRDSGDHVVPAERFWRLPLRSALLALLSGLMLTAAFPPGSLHWIAWFSLTPLFWSLAGRRPSAVFRLGVIAGLAHFVSLLYWIVLVLNHYGNLDLLVSIWPFLLLSLYLSLYVGFFTLFVTLDSRSSSSAIAWASAWVGLEYVRSWLLTGFPWCLLGTSQYEQLPLVQLSSVTGVYGLSFLIVLVNALVFQVCASIRKGMSRILKWEMAVAAFLLAAALVYGHSALVRDRGQRPGVMARVAIAQANVDQSVKWDPAYQEETIHTYRTLTLEVRPFHPELVVWPETATPFFYQDNHEYAPLVTALAREMGAILIFGSPAYQETGGNISYFNRAYLLSPAHPHRPMWYDKVHLVPFGEYVPLKRWLPFVHRLVPAAGDFEAGRAVHPLQGGGLAAGVLICFEAIFPEIARKHVLKGASVLVNLTNDAWFGMTSAPHQHLAMAVFRAAENARPLVRAANTGISAFIDARGRITAKSGLFVQCALKGHVHLQEHKQTLYTRFGDWFAYGLIAFTLYRSLRFLIRKERT